MSAKTETGGPAFPTDNEQQTGPSSYHYAGMTLRDYFAAKAMVCFVMQPDSDDFSELEIARVSYAQADAMLKVREEQGGPKC